MGFTYEIISWNPSCSIFDLPPCCCAWEQYKMVQSHVEYTDGVPGSWLQPLRPSVSKLAKGKSFSLSLPLSATFQIIKYIKTNQPTNYTAFSSTGCLLPWESCLADTQQLFSKGVMLECPRHSREMVLGNYLAEDTEKHWGTDHVFDSLATWICWQA